MTEWHAVIPPPAVATAMMRPALPASSKRVVAPAGSGTVGNDAQNRHPPPDTHVRHPVVVPPRPDTDRPTGPPPAFEANVLEAEALRRRHEIAEEEAGHDPDMAEDTDAEVRPAADLPANDADDKAAAAGPEKPGSANYYSGLPGLAEPQIDLIR